MKKANPYQTYQKADMTAADPVKVIVMLYEGAIRNLRQTVGHFEAGRKTQASERINKTLKIVQYLSTSLNHEKGGEIAHNLENLYDYVRDTLAMANIDSDTAKIKSAIDVLEPLLEGWQTITTEQKKAEQNSVPKQKPSSSQGLSAVG